MDRFKCFGEAILLELVLTSFELGLLLVFSCYQALRLFLVWDAEGEDDREDTAIEELFQCLDDSDGEDAGEKKRRVERSERESPASVRHQASRAGQASQASQVLRRILACESCMPVRAKCAIQ